VPPLAVAVNVIVVPICCGAIRSGSRVSSVSLDVTMLYGTLPVDAG